MKGHTNVVESQSYACSLCQEKFTDLTLLEAHEFQHDLINDNSLLQQNLNMVNESLMLDHNLMSADHQHENA